MFDFTITENEVTLSKDLVVTEMFRVHEEDITRVEFYRYNTWVVAYIPCINGVWGSLHMDENFRVFYQGEPSYEAILKHAGVLNENKIVIFRR